MFGSFIRIHQLERKKIIFLMSEARNREMNEFFSAGFKLHEQLLFSFPS